MIDSLDYGTSRTFEPDDLHFGHSGTSRMNSNFGLHVTVAFTSAKGTLAALTTAARLAKNLGAQIAIVVPRLVPANRPLTQLPESVRLLESGIIAFVHTVGVGVDEVSVETHLCHDRMRCLQQILAQRPLVVIGGRRRELDPLLRQLGHRVIFVDENPRSPRRPFLSSCNHAIHSWILRLARFTGHASSGFRKRLHRTRDSR